VVLGAPFDKPEGRRLRALTGGVVGVVWCGDGCV
jgi:hypothetical protein